MRHNYNYDKFVHERSLGNREVREEGKDLTVEYSFSEAIDEFLNVKKAEGCRKSTIREYNLVFGYLTRFLSEYKPKIRYIHELSSADVRDYINFLQFDRIQYKGISDRENGKVGLAPATINIRIRNLKTFYNFLNREGYTDINPMTPIKQLRTDTEKIRYFTDDEINKILNVIDVKTYAGFRSKILIYFYLDGGYRVAEPVNLRKSDSDFERRIVTLPANESKTRKYRDVPVSKFVPDLIGRLIKENERFFGESEYIFLSAFGDPLKPDAIRRSFHRYANRAGLQQIQPGRFRHTFAIKYLKKGGDIMTLSRIMGHSSIKTTENYLQFSSDDIVAAHEKFAPSKDFYKRKLVRNL